MKHLHIVVIFFNNGSMKEESLKIIKINFGKKLTFTIIIIIQNPHRISKKRTDSHLLCYITMFLYRDFHQEESI